MQVPSHRALPRRRASRPGVFLTGGLAALAIVLAVVLTAGFLLGHGRGPARPITATAADPTSCPTAGPAAARCGPAPPAPRTGASPSPTPSHSATPAPTPKRRHTPVPNQPSARPTRTTTPTPTQTPTSGSADARAAASVLAAINQARARAGLPAYTISSGLDASARKHNLLMADGCGLSHQCPGERPLGDRETAAGVHWTAAGENVGEGGPTADTAEAITQLALALTRGMLDEKPPNDGHRRNLLSTDFTHIGIAVNRDSRWTAWMTQDLSN